MYAEDMILQKANMVEYFTRILTCRHMSLVPVAKKLSELARTLWMPRSAIESAQNDHTTVVHSILKNKAEKFKVGLHMQNNCFVCIRNFCLFLKLEIWKMCFAITFYIIRRVCIGRCGPLLTLLPGVAINNRAAIGIGDEETGDHCCDCSCTKLPPGRHSTWALILMFN